MTKEARSSKNREPTRPLDLRTLSALNGSFHERGDWSPDPVRPMFVTFGRQCRDAVNRLAAAGVDFVFPKVCSWCGDSDVGEPAAVHTGIGPLLCTACREQVAPPIANACLRCGAPIGPFLDPTIPCSHCRRDRFTFQRVFALGVYDGTLRQACLQSQRPDGDVLASALAAILYERIVAATPSSMFDVVVPIPRYWMHRVTRPHNVAETLAHALAGQLEVTFRRDVLRKVRKTPAQADLSPTERRKNLKNAFRAVRPKSIAGKSVLVVDDIMTTGTTANEAARVLKRAGAKSVTIAVFARGLGGR